MKLWRLFKQTSRGSRKKGSRNRTMAGAIIKVTRQTKLPSQVEWKIGKNDRRFRIRWSERTGYRFPTETEWVQGYYEPDDPEEPVAQTHATVDDDYDDDRYAGRRRGPFSINIGLHGWILIATLVAIVLLVVFVPNGGNPTAGDDGQLPPGRAGEASGGAFERPPGDRATEVQPEGPPPTSIEMPAAPTPDPYKEFRMELGESRKISIPHCPGAPIFTINPREVGGLLTIYIDKGAGFQLTGSSIGLEGGQTGIAVVDGCIIGVRGGDGGAYISVPPPR